MNNTYRWLNKEKSRYYTIAIQKRSPGEIILNYSWGGCNSNRGGKKSLLVESHEEVQKYVNLMMKRRKSRGYELIAPIMH
jgi:predicted DNA-binding WGR domain protein